MTGNPAFAWTGAADVIESGLNEIGSLDDIGSVIGFSSWTLDCNGSYGRFRQSE